LARIVRQLRRFVLTVFNLRFFVLAQAVALRLSVIPDTESLATNHATG